MTEDSLKGILRLRNTHTLYFIFRNLRFVSVGIQKNPLQGIVHMTSETTENQLFLLSYNNAF
jgi:hypothetical protein